MGKWELRSCTNLYLAIVEILVRHEIHIWLRFDVNNNTIDSEEEVKLQELNLQDEKFVQRFKNKALAFRLISTIRESFHCLSKVAESKK